MIIQVRVIVGARSIAVHKIILRTIQAQRERVLR